MSKQKTLDELVVKEEPADIVKPEGGELDLLDLDPELAEKLIANGDLSALDANQRNAYYLYMCKRAGLDPAGRPFEYIKFTGGKIMLYPKKGCAEQLRKIHGISVIELRTEKINNEYIVSCIVKDRTGRTEADVGVSPAQDSNSLMKAVTKAKRRATLAICGLGALEEALPSEFSNGEEPNECKSAILLEDESEGKRVFRDVVTSKTDVDNLDNAIWNNIIQQSMRLADTSSYETAARWLQEKGTIKLDKDDNGNVVKATIKEVNNGKTKG